MKFCSFGEHSFCIISCGARDAQVLGKDYNHPADMLDFFQFTKVCL